MPRLNDMVREHIRPLLMGIVNATGDSFSEGKASAPETAVDRALALLDDGADLLDIGGESTRPGSEIVPEEEEIRRVIPVIRALRKLRPTVILSIDTRKAAVVRAALEYGVELVNDVSMLRYSPAMAATVAASDAALLIAHSRGTPQNMADAGFHDYGDDPVATVIEELKGAKTIAREAGIPEERIWIDPNFGFAKTPEQDWELLRRIDEFHQLGPVAAGISRKSFLGHFLAQPDPKMRLGGTVAAAVYLAEREIEILRVHDVRQVGDALRVWKELR